MKKILDIILWMVLTGGLLVLLGFALANYRNVKCSQVEIRLSDSCTAGFINEQDIRQIIISHFGVLQGQLLDSINTDSLESILRRNAYLSNADVVKSIQGIIRVEAEREEPLVRIVNQAGEGFYLSRRGCLLPLSRDFVPRMLVASGAISESYHTGACYAQYTVDNPFAAPLTSMEALHYLCSQLASHPALSKHIVQIFFDPDGEIELVPADGSHVILIGDVNDLPRKFRKLLAFYRVARQEVPDGYSVVNLKYSNQVFCKK
jgi:cell division protein FtsQ